MKPIYGWWFCSKDKRLPHGDNRRIRLGRTHKIKGQIALCSRGLHMSNRALDALYYAPGPILYRVRAGGIVEQDDDKFVCSERTYIAGGINVSTTLRKFACLCALDVIDLWRAPPIVVRYLKSQDESIRPFARFAAWDAARAAWAAAGASWDAAEASARAARAAGAAAGDSVWADAGDAARAADWAAGYAARAADWAAEYAVGAAVDAAGAAARAAAGAAAWDAARAAARTAAGAAARAKQNRRLERMFHEAIRHAAR